MTPSTTVLSHDQRRLLYTLGGLLLVAVVVAGLLGFGNFVGLLLGAVQLALLGLTLYLFYRLVLAAERIARALEND